MISWIPLSLCREVYEQHLETVKNTLDSDSKREKWKVHSLYKAKKRNGLEDICRSLKIPVHGNVSKFELVRLISEHNSEVPPMEQVLYSGALVKVPTTQAGISKLPVSKLRAILKWHGISIFGNKDVLVRTKSATTKSWQNSLNIQQRGGRVAGNYSCEIAKKLILEERRVSIVQSPVYKSRKVLYIFFLR